MRAITLLILIGLIAAGCSSGEQTAREGSGTFVTARITNRNFIAVEIHAVGPARQAYLGRLAAGATKTYGLPDDFITTATPIRFQVESVDRTMSFLTDEVLAIPGEEIILIIPNQR